MTFFDDITSVITAPIRAVNATIALPGQLVKEVGSTALGIAGVAGKVASTGISASIRSVESISTSPFRTAENVAGIAGQTVQGVAGSVSSAAENVGQSLAMPLAVAGAAVLLVMLLRDR